MFQVRTKQITISWSSFPLPGNLEYTRDVLRAEDNHLLCFSEWKMDIESGNNLKNLFVCKLFNWNY